MLRYFSLPIIIGIATGLAIPFVAQSLIWLSSILLFLLLFLNTLAVDLGSLKTQSLTRGLHCGLSVALIFFIWPVVQTALAVMCLKDPDFVFGVAVSALAPCALVNPFFARHRNGDAPLALLNVVVTTLLCPLLTVPVLHLLGFQAVFIDSHYLMVFLGLLTVGPLVLGFIMTWLWPAVRQQTTRVLPLANSVLLGLLMFILVGSSLPRVPFRLLLSRDLLTLLVLFLLFDFGLYWLTRWAAALYMTADRAEAMALSLATRNFAVSASLMLLFHPKAALPSAVGLVVHSLFFQWLLWKKHDTRSV